MKISISPDDKHRPHRSTSRAPRLRAALAGLAVLAATVGASIALAPGAAAVSCTPTGFTQDNQNLTARLVVTGTDVNVTSPIDATGCNIGVYFAPGASGSVSGVTITGAPNYYGILVNGAAVNVTDSHVNDVGETPHNGTQHGIGIAYRNGASGTVSGNEVTNYQKGGILVTSALDGTGPSTATVSDNVVTGDGRIDFIAQNGIQVSFGSSATVTGNAVSDNFYTPTTNVACGLLYFEANGVRAARNHYRGDERNVCNFGQRGGGNP